MEGSEYESKNLGVDADAVRYKMHEPGFIEKEMPSVSTIKRIVKKHNLKVNKQERYKRVKSKKCYLVHIEQYAAGFLKEFDYMITDEIKALRRDMW